MNNLVAVVVATLVYCSTTNAAEMISLRERVVLKASVVRLADVVEIGSGQGELGRKLAELPLMPAPAPGTQRFLLRREIADLLAAHGVDLRDVKFGGAAQVEISTEADAWKSSGARTASTVEPRLNRHAAILAGQPAGHTNIAPVETGRAEALRDQLSQVIVSYLETKGSQTATWVVNCELSEQHFKLLEAASGPVEVRGGSVPWTGRQRFTATIETPQGAVQVPVYAEVDATSIPVVVAVRPIGRGEPITAAAVELQTVDHLPGGNSRRAVAESMEELIGMEVRQSIRAGEVVFSDQVQPPLLVKRGELITISSHAGGIRIRTTARARENGSKGDLVQVESVETRERFEARVVGSREAAVFAQTRPAYDEPSDRDNVARRPLR